MTNVAKPDQLDSSSAPLDLLQTLLHSTTLKEAKEVVALLAEAHQFAWVPVGNRENNYGQINIGSNPGFALIERVTNALDGVIELASVRKGGKLPLNPREAVERWFGIEAGRQRNLALSERQEIADRVVVSLMPGSGAKSRPTVSIRDLGIGLTPELFPRSILGLGESNKIDKPFLAGAYGQGGSTTFAFSPGGTLIASRRHPELVGEAVDQIALSFVRFRDLDPTVNKNGRYEYLVTPDGAVPAIPAKDNQFEPGTLVVHFDYELSSYSAALTQITGSLWWLLQNALFDPVLPFWAEDHRKSVTKKDRPERRSITGNHTRLWNDRRDKLEHTDSVQLIIPEENGESLVVAHYWVAGSDPNTPKGERPIEVYVDPINPITYTFFGQTHGVEDRRFIRNRLQLSYLDRYLVLQVELDQLSPSARRALLSTTRDRLKESDVYHELRERLATALAEDAELQRINEERKAAILSRYSEDERQKMRARFARLMDHLRSGRDAEVPSKGQQAGGRPEKPSQSREPLEPLPTKDEPTFLRVANKQSPIPVRIDRAALLRLESDAQDGYLAGHAPHAKIVVVAEPEDEIVMESVSDFRGGRARAIVRPGSEATEGTEGTLDVFLFTPDGKSFRQRVKFVLQGPREAKTEGSDRRGKVKAPEPVPIYQSDWSRLDWDETSVAQVDKDETGVRILINMDNRHITRLLEGGGYKETGLARMKNNYLLYTAYFAWLQDCALAENDHGLSGEEFETYQAEELDRASQTVVSAIAAEGRLG